MAQRGPVLAKLTLSDNERDQLERWVRRRKSAQDLALRSRIVLECSTGASNSEVSRRLGISMPTVRKWRSRFIDHRLDGWQRSVSTRLNRSSSTPANATHWSRASMAEKSGLSKSKVGRIWKAFGLKPHLEEGSSSPTTRCLPRRSTTLSGCTSIHRNRRSCCRSMRKASTGTATVPAGAADDAGNTRAAQS